MHSCNDHQRNTFHSDDVMRLHFWYSPTSKRNEKTTLVTPIEHRIKTNNKSGFKQDIFWVTGHLYTYNK